MSTATRSPVSKEAKKILSSGHNSSLLRSRNALIQSAGYQVVTTRESVLLLQLAQEQHFDAVVLCNSIPIRLRTASARDLKQLKLNLALIVICADGEESDFRDLADEIIRAESGISQPLLEAISKLAGEPD